MKNKIYAAIFIVVLALISFSAYREYERIKEERDLYKSNTGVLMQDNYKYKVSDSLNALSSSALRISVSEMAKYRKAEYDLIANLNIKGRDIEAITLANLKTENKVAGIVKDSINKNDTLHCLDIKSKWYEVSGCEQNGKFQGLIVSKDSLIVVESVKLKRFLGFLWKTKKVKDRKLDVVSKNPNTKILGVEFIKIIN